MNRLSVNTRNLLIFILIGGLGGVLGAGLGFPLPYLTGSALAVGLVNFWGVKAEMPNHMRDGVFILLGLNMGGGVNPEMVDIITKWPQSFILLFLLQIFTIFGLAALLKAGFHMRKDKAVYMATPGHLSFVIALGMDKNRDMGDVILVQALRVLTLTLIIPFMIGFLGYEFRPITDSNMSYLSLMGLFILSLITGYVLQKLKISAAYLMGGLIVSALAHVLGFVEGALPPLIFALSFVLLGVLIASRLKGAGLNAFQKIAGQAVLVISFGLLCSLLFASLAFWIFHIEWIDAVLAYAPGGLEAMVAMSFVLDADVSYVAAHHIARLFMIVVILLYAEKRFDADAEKT